MVYEKSKVVKYLVVTFVIAYLMQFGVRILAELGNAAMAQLLMAVMMFVPALGVIAAGYKLKDFGWKIQLKKNMKYILIAWFGPFLLTVLGAAIYFMIFRNHFDLSGSYLTSVAGKDALAQLEAQGVTYPTYVMISAISSITYAPIINMLLALGEEIGWRGFLYPQLEAKFGKQKGWLLGGAIWGAWHWPVIWLIGYEYGFDYVGFPIVGMLLFCVFTMLFGVLCGWLYERTNSMWVPAICHGALNGAAALPLAVCIPTIGSAILLGPAPHGLIAMIPLGALIVFLLFKS